MERVIAIEAKTISGEAYAVAVPKGLIRSFKQGVFIEDILPECVIHKLPLSDPKAAADVLVRLAQHYDNAELLDVPDTVQAFIKQHLPSRS